MESRSKIERVFWKWEKKFVANFCTRDTKEKLLENRFRDRERTGRRSRKKIWAQIYISPFESKFSTWVLKMVCRNFTFRLWLIFVILFLSVVVEETCWNVFFLCLAPEMKDNNKISVYQQESKVWRRKQNLFSHRKMEQTEEVLARVHLTFNAK